MFSSTSSDIDLHAAVIADPSGSNPAWREIIRRVQPAIRKSLLGLAAADREDAMSFALTDVFRRLPSVDPTKFERSTLVYWAKDHAARTGRREVARERFSGIDDRKVHLARKIKRSLAAGLTIEESASDAAVTVAQAKIALSDYDGYESTLGDDAFLYEETPAADAVAADGLALVARVVADLVGSDHPDYAALLTLTGASEIGTGYDKAHDLLDTGFRDIESLRKRLRRTLSAKFPEAASDNLAAVTAAYLRGEVAA